MSGIFKGDSIYKSGGGGGYKDGGELVDGDFIKVENNTISSYDNVSRDPVNFYFDVADGEVLNSVVELTTSVNATINVYVVKNGFYYLIGNVGGNTVNAGDDYKINIVGNSFMLEVVTPSQSYPEAVNLGGKIYVLKKYGNTLWCTSDLTGFNGHEKDGRYYYTHDEIENILPQLNGFRPPTISEKNELCAIFGNSGGTGIADVFKSTDGSWPIGTATDTSGLSFKNLKGYLDLNDGNLYSDWYSCWLTTWLPGDPRNMLLRNDNNNFSNGLSGGAGDAYGVRLVLPI